MEELTLRRGEEGVLRTFVDTTTVGDNRWGPPSWTRTGTQSAMPSTSTSRERRGTMYYKDVELGRAVNICQPSTSRKAKTLWKVREPKAKGDECYERDSERKSESRVAVLQALLEKKNLQGPGMALDVALRRKAVLEDRADSSAAEEEAGACLCCIVRFLCLPGRLVVAAVI